MLTGNGYLIEYIWNTATYYLSDNDSVVFDMDMEGNSVAAVFRADALKVAIVEAQTGAPACTYRGFRGKAKSAGCAGYLVSLGGRKVLYFGPSGETHTEYMPAS